MGKLTSERIDELASGAGIRAIAVKNFLRSMCSVERDARANLQLDAALYRWNLQTIDAIRTGINEAFKR